MEWFKNALASKAIAWILTACLVITLIPDIGYATDTNLSKQSTVTTESDSTQIEGKNLQTKELEDFSSNYEDPSTLEPEGAGEPDVIETAENQEESDEDEIKAVNDPAMEGFSENDVIEKTETTTTFAIGDGLNAKVFHGGEVRFENEEGELIDYDPSLVQIKSGERSDQDTYLNGYEYRNNIGDKKQFLPEMLSEKTPIIMEYDGNQITITPTDDTVRYLGIDQSEVQVENDIVPDIYEGEGEIVPVNAVYGNKTDAAVFTYTSGDAGIKETLTLNEKPASNVFTYELYAGDLKVKENELDEGITFIDPETDDIIAGIEAPWMNDATGDAYSTEITYNLEKVADEEGLYILTMALSEEYLADEERVYPVTVDPTVTWKGNDMIRDTYIIYGSGYAGTNFYDTSNTKMPVGTNSTGRHRTLFKILNLKAEIEGMSVASAKLTLYESGTGASGQLIRANRLIEDWTPSTVTWNNQPEWNTAAYTAQVTTSGTKNTAKVFDCTAFAKNVSNGTSNYGLILRNMTTDPSYACFWGSRYATTAYRPKLVVEYYSVPTKATSASMEIKSNAAGIKSGSHLYVQNSTDTVINYTGITSTGLERVEHRIWTYDDNTKEIGEIAVDYGASSAIESGGTTPSLSGGCYKVNIRGVNKAGVAGDFKYAGHVHVDKTAPSFSSCSISPATTSSSKTSKTNPTVSWNVSDKHFKTLSVSFEGEEVYSTSVQGSGSYTLSSGYIKNPGEYNITVKATDKAGRETTKSFTYYVKSVGAHITDISITPEGTGAEPVNKQDPTVSWTVSGEDIDSLDLYVNGERVTDTNITTSTRSYKLNQNLLPISGEYEIKVYVTDVRRRQSYKKINYNLDITAPMIDEVVTIPETGLLNASNNRSPKIKWKINEADVASISFSLDNTNWTVLGTTQSGEAVFPSSAWTAGTGNKTIYFKATDKAGNDSIIKEVKYNLGNGGSYAPQDLTVKEYYGKRVLTWELDAYDESYIKYDIHRSTAAGFTPSTSTLIESNVTGGELYYIDNDVLSSGTYYYAIVVKDTRGTMSDVISNKVSYTNSFTISSLKNTIGNKEYLSYTSVGLPTGTINVEESSGNVMFEQDDFELSNPQLGYGMSRTYNSQLNLTSMVGKGWMDSYHKEIYDSGSNIYLLESDGSIYKYSLSSGTYVSNEYPGSGIVKTNTGYTMSTKENITYKFNKSGQLFETSELNGCKITNIYDCEGKLSSVVSSADDSATKTLDFVYKTNSSLLESVTDHCNTVYTYGYSGNNLQNLTVSCSSDDVFYGYLYDSSGKLKIINDAERNGYEIVYASNKADYIEYPDGEKITFTYSTGKTVIKKYPPTDTEITDPVFEESTSFDTATGKILSHVDPVGRTTSYTYKTDNPYLIATTSSERGFESFSSATEFTISSDTATATVHEYNSAGDIKSETTEDGTQVTYVYNANGNLTSEMSVKGGTTITNNTYTYEQNTENLKQMTDSVQNIVETYTYNDDGQEQVTTVKDDGVQVAQATLTYDSEGNADSEITKSGENEDNINSTFDAMGRELVVTEDGIVTTKEYDYLGRLVRETISEENSDIDDVIKTYSYDRNGSLICETDSSGVKTVYVYDERNRVIEEITTGSGIDTRTVTTSYGFDEDIKIEDGRGGRTENVVYTETVTSATGSVIIKYIDKAGNVVKELADKTFTDYTYDKSDNQVVVYRGNTVDSDAEITVQAHDKNGNVIAEVTNPGVNGQKYVINSNSVAVHRSYDSKGNMTNERSILDINQAENITVYVRDSQDRIKEINVGNDYDVDIEVSYTTKNGDTVTTVTDLNGNKKNEYVDEAGNLRSVRDWDVDTSECIYTSYGYDTLGRKVREEYNDGGIIRFTYDGDSDRIKSKKAYMGASLEREFIYNYTGYGRLESVICKDGAGSIYCTTEYLYDAEGKVIEESVTCAGQSKQTTKSEYDADGKLESVTYPNSSNLGKVSYSYDSNGRIKTISNSSGTIREYFYDGLGRINYVKDFDKPGATSFIYKAYTYDSNGRISSMTYMDNGSSGSILESFVYTYKTNSNDIDKVTHVNNMPTSGKKINETRQYVYDDHGNLTQSTKTNHLSSDAKSVIKYTYDPVGNRLTETVGNDVTSYIYNGLNQLKSTSVNGTKTAEYSYDEKGNLIQEDDLINDQSKVIRYAVTGEMTSYVEKNDTAELLQQQNIYDHNGQRISRTQSGMTRNYYYDRGVVAFTMDGTSLSGANVLDAEGEAIGTYRGSVYYNYLKDGQASTTNLVKQDGTLAAAYDYTDFGETTEITGNSLDNQICYTGGIYDKETGLYYLNARYYDPKIGRFISQDSYRGELDDVDQWHLYAYCANNPINYVDPSGHWNWPVSFKFGYVRRGAVATVLDGVIAVCCGGWTLPAKKMLKDALKKDMKKMKTKTKREIKKIVYDATKKVKNQLSNKGKKMWNEMNKKAKKIKNNAVKSRVYKFLNKPKVKDLFNSNASGFVSGKITGFVGQVLDYNTIDCVTSIGGFVAGIVEYQVDGYLGDAKIHF